MTASIVLSCRRSKRRSNWNLLGSAGCFLFFYSQLFLQSTSNRYTKHYSSIELSFSTCGGFSNQVLSVAYVLTFAATTKVDVLVAPALNSNGRQLGGVDLHPNAHLEGGFEQLFDWQTTSTFLKQQGIMFTRKAKTPLGTKYVLCEHDHTLEECELQIAKRCNAIACHVHVQCPFLHRIWNVTFLKKNKVLFNEALSALAPSEGVRQLASELVDTFRRQEPAHCTTFVHLRVERDWHMHCKSWPPAKVDPLKCAVNTSAVVHQLHAKNISDCAIFLSYDAADVDAKTLHELEILKSNVVLRVFDGNDILSKNVPAREVRAAINVALAVNYFDFFIGNSVSTMSALIIRERRAKRLWAAQYNRGAIPLSEFIPGFSIPWVFTVRGTDAQYDEMMKVAVRSAIQKTSLIPYCMVHPDELHFERVRWLRSMNVTVCVHRPTWEKRLLEILQLSTESARKSSHLYADPKQVLGTYFRIDLAALPELVQFEHVLYTDTDVLFTDDITTLQGESLSLPSTIQLAIEQPGLKVLNAGVFVASVSFLRKTHEGLIRTLLESDSVSYGIYGPGDQGLLNKFYSKELIDSGLLADDAFNAKLYDATHRAKIIHFHGPKPSDYEEAAAHGNCKRFPALCDRGITNKLFCSFVTSWIQYCDDECDTRYPNLKALCRSVG